MESIMGFIAGNISYILLGVGILYLIWFVTSFINSRKTGEEFHFRLKYLIAFVAIVGLAIYSLVTGQDFTKFIG